MRKIPFVIDILATGFYMGKIPKAPGTFGSLVAIPLGYLCSFLPIYINFLIFFAIFFVGVYVSQKCMIISGIDDPKWVVIDEVAGLLLFYIIFPYSIMNIVAGFILFRFFDIVKPFPVSFFDNIKNGLGIMLDDIAATLYAILIWAIVTQLVQF